MRTCGSLCAWSICQMEKLLALQFRHCLQMHTNVLCCGVVVQKK